MRFLIALAALCFLAFVANIALCERLRGRGVAPHIFESAAEVKGDWRHETGAT